MEAKEMKEKFVSLYNMMATSNNVKICTPLEIRQERCSTGFW